MAEKKTLHERVAQACEAAEDDMDYGSDHYDEPVVTVAALRKMLRKAPKAAQEVKALLAQAWDEGYALDWTGGVRWDNPYRKAKD